MSDLTKVKLLLIMVFMAGCTATDLLLMSKGLVNQYSILAIILVFVASGGLTSIEAITERLQNNQK